MTHKPLAKDYYLAAQELRSRLNVADFDRSITLFEKAIEVDPNYGAAYAMFASACQAHWELDPSGSWLEKGNIAAEAAVRLVPMMPEAQRAQAGMHRYCGQLRKALDAYLSAYELDQTSDRAAVTVGNAEGDLGRPDLALRWYEKAVRRQPRPGIYSEHIGDAYTDLGEDRRAEAEFRNASVFRPDLADATIGLARLAFFRGDFLAQNNYARMLSVDSRAIGSFSALVQRSSFTLDILMLPSGSIVISLPSTAPVTLTLLVRLDFSSAVGFIECVAGDKRQGRASAGRSACAGS